MPPAGRHSLWEEGGRPARELRPHSGVAAGGVAVVDSSVPVPQGWQEQQKPIKIPWSLCRCSWGFPAPKMAAPGVWRKHRSFGARPTSQRRNEIGGVQAKGAGRTWRKPEGRERE